MVIIVVGFEGLGGHDFSFLCLFGAAFSNVIFLGLFFLIFQFLCLFVVSDLLKSIEIFTRLLVKFAVDEIDDVLNPWDLNEFKGIDSSVSDFKCYVKCRELCLQRCDGDQHLQESDESLTSAVNSLTTAGKTEKCSAVLLFIFSSEREDGQLDTSDVFSVDVQPHVSPGLNVVQDIAREIASSEVSACQTKGSLFEVEAHTDLRLDDLLKDAAEGLFEGIRLLFEELETFLSTDCLLLVKLEVPIKEVRLNAMQDTYILDGRT